MLKARCAVAAAFIILAPAALPLVWAQQTTETARPTIGVAAPRPVATASRAAEAPTIDGILDDPAWQQATPLTDFIQADPLEGEPASEKTEVRILFDDDAIFVGVTCYDSNPSQIITTDTRRDSGLEQMDSFRMIFDTYRDRQNGFVFGTNAAGIQYDAQVRNQGNVSASWDGSWEVKTSTSEIGWTAEFRIPLRTLRYGSPPQVWGLNLTRNIHRRREEVYWAPLARIYNLGRLSSAGELGGLDLKAPRNFKLTPYASSSANRNFAPRSKTDLDRDWGVDAKVGLTPSLNLDLTYNTDFAQVEVDTQQINLTRFNLRFPEKRPFFLENSGLFAVGKGGETDLFFSRRIGVSDDGSLVPIRGGVRLSGRTNGVNVGLLNMQTDDVGRTPANNFTAARMNRELPNRSSVGVIFLNRTATGRKAGNDNWNRTWGTDGKLGIGERVTLAGFAARTETPGLSGRQYAYNVDSAYDDGKHRVYFEYGRTGEDFNPEVGFLERTEGYRRLNMGWYETVRQAPVREKGFRELLPHVSYERYDHLGGGIQTARLHVDNHFDWENGYFLSPALNVIWEGLERPFEVYPGVLVPPGVYRSPNFTFRVNTDRRKWLFGRIQWDRGGFLSGRQNNRLHEVILREGGKFTVSLTWTRNDIDLPQGAFVTNLANLRASYNFTPSIFTQSLIQYNDRTQRWSTNLRFHWLQTAGTGFFVVYNDTESLNGFGPVNRAFIIKYVRQFDILR